MSANIDIFIKLTGSKWPISTNLIAYYKQNNQHSNIKSVHIKGINMLCMYVKNLWNRKTLTYTSNNSLFYGYPIHCAIDIAPLLSYASLTWHSLHKTTYWGEIKSFCFCYRQVYTHFKMYYILNVTTVDKAYKYK